MKTLASGLMQAGLVAMNSVSVFPPDWVGNFVYEMTDTNSDRTFEAGTVVNFESQFFSPELSGITYYIDTLLFKEDEAILPLQTPRRLVCMV